VDNAPARPGGAPFAAPGIPPVQAIDALLAPFQQSDPTLFDGVWQYVGQFGQRGEVAFLAKLSKMPPFETPRDILQRFRSETARWDQNEDSYSGPVAAMEDIPTLIDSLSEALPASRPFPLYNLKNPVNMALFLFNAGFGPVTPGVARQSPGQAYGDHAVHAAAPNAVEVAVPPMDVAAAGPNTRNKRSAGSVAELGAPRRQEGPMPSPSRASRSAEILTGLQAASLEAIQLVDILRERPEDARAICNQCTWFTNPGSPFSQVAQVYEKAWLQPAVLTWATENGVDLDTAIVRGGLISAEVRGEVDRKNFSGRSPGWGWEMEQIVDAAGRLDLHGMGLPYNDGKSGYGYAMGLAFYGYTPPKTQAEAEAIAQHILDNGRNFSAFTMWSGSLGPDNARFRSFLRSEGANADLHKIYTVLNAKDGDATGNAVVSVADDLDINDWVEAHPDSPFALMYRSARDELRAIAASESAMFHIESIRQGALPPFSIKIAKDRQGVISCRLLNAGENTGLDISKAAYTGVQLSTLANRLPPGQSVSVDNVIPFGEFYHFYLGSDHAVNADDLRRFDARSHLAEVLSLTPGDQEAEFVLEAKLQAIGNNNNRAKLGRELEDIVKNDSVSDEIEDRRRRFDPDPASSFAKALQKELPGVREMTQDPAFLSLREKKMIDRSGYVIVSETGSIGCFSENREWVRLDGAIRNIPGLAEKAQKCVEGARRLGGRIRDNGEVRLAEVLAYEDGSSSLPTTAAQVVDVIRRLGYAVPESPRLGDYRRPSQRELATEDWEKMMPVMRDFFSGTTLPGLDFLGRAVISGKKESEVRATPDLLMEQILNSSVSQALAKKLLLVLGWYGGRDDEACSRSVREKLLLCALIQHMDSSPEGPGMTGAWLRNIPQGMSYARIRTEFEKYLLRTGKATAASAPLVAHTMLAGISPDLLVRDVPREFGFRSHGWVMLRQGVELAEFLAPGSSRYMGFAQLLALAAEPNPSDAVKLFMASAAVGPVLEWAEANGIVEPGHANATSSEHIDAAIKAYEVKGKKLQEAVSAISKEFSWEDIAKTALESRLFYYKRSDDPGVIMKEVRPGIVDFYLRPAVDPDPKSLIDVPTLEGWKGYPILDVYMSGELGKDPAAWVCHSSATSEQKAVFSQVRRGAIAIPGIGRLREGKLYPYVDDYIDGVATIISESFVKYPVEDRRFLAYGQLKFYRPKGKAVDDGIAIRIEAGYGGETKDYVVRMKDMDIRRMPANGISTYEFEYISAMSTAHSGSASDGIPSHYDFEGRSAVISGYILPRDELRASLAGRTFLEQEIEGERKARQIVRAVVDVFNPVSWYGDLKSDNTMTRVFGGLGFVGFAGGLFAPVVAVGRGVVPMVRGAATFRIAAPQMGTLVGKASLAMIASLNPVGGVAPLLRGAWKVGSKAVVRLSGTAGELASQGATMFKRLPGMQRAERVVIPSRTRLGIDSPSQSRIVDDVSDVAIGQDPAGRDYVLDSASGRLVGPPLTKVTRDGKLSSRVPGTIPVLDTRGRRVFEDKTALPRRSWLVDESRRSVILESDGMVVASYRNGIRDDGSSVLLKVDDATGIRSPKSMEVALCRSRRGVGLIPCGTAAGQVQTPGFMADITAPGIQGYMKWFGQERMTPASGSSAFVHDGVVHTVKDGVIKPASITDIPALGADTLPRYREQISATIEGGSDDFKQIFIAGGLDERISDARSVSAVVVEHIETKKFWMVTEADTGKFYIGEVGAGGPISMKKVDVEQDVLDGLVQPFSDADELAIIMRGSLNANAQYRLFPEPVVLEKSLGNLESLLKSAHFDDDYLLGKGRSFKLATTDAQAVMFAPRPRVAFNAQIDVRLGWPASLPVETSVLEVNGKFYSSTLNRLFKDRAVFSVADFTTADSAKNAIRRLQIANGMEDTAVARVILSDGTTEIHYAGFKDVGQPVADSVGLAADQAAKGPRWLAAARYSADPYVSSNGLSLPPLSSGANGGVEAAQRSVESQIINAIYRDHPNPGAVVDIKLWVTGNRDPAAPFYYQALTNPGVPLRVYDPATNLLMADIPQMRQVTQDVWGKMDQSSVPAGVKTAFDGDFAYAEGIPYIYTWKDGRKSYIAWVQDEKTLFLREGGGSTWSIPERYDYKEIHTWQTPTGKESSLKTADIDPGRSVLIPERLHRAKQGIKDGVLLDPIKVRTAEGGRFAVVDGNHRLQAARDLGLDRVPYILE
jgi:hypothetical protein